MLRTTILAIAVSTCSGSFAVAQQHEALFPFVLPWDDASDNVTNVSHLLHKPAGKFGQIVARGEHLHAGETRQRFFGVNLCFGGNFPSRDDAPIIAARLARFGVNCVRFHHMDSTTAPGGILAKDMQSLDTDQLDKLDYFIAQLKQYGVYTNLNLHVSRTYPNMPEWDGAPSFFKGVDIFYEPMIASQKQFARDLLTHVNPYTKLSYATDPAVAFVEINNENGLIYEWWNGALDDMPAGYADPLATLWRTHLRDKYQDFQTLKAAWAVGEEKPGDEMLTNGNFNSGTENWNLESHGTSSATVRQSADGNGVTIDVVQPSEIGWHVQFSQSQLKMKKGAAYTVTVKGVRSDAARTTRLMIRQAHEPWGHLASVDLPLTTTPTDHTFVLVSSESEDNARLIFSPLGQHVATFTIGEVSLRPGGRVALEDEAQWSDLALFRKKSYGRHTPTAALDWMTFLWKIESNYWLEMQRFLKDEVGVKSLIVGSATGFSPPAIQAQLDVVDGHAYWQHPHFPGRPWDRANWHVGNVSMAGHDNGATLPHLTMRRVFGKPYIVTEYNSAAPNTFGSETFLIANAYASLQDWDGMFPFAYSHRHNDWRSGRISGFFDVDQHPTKLATFPVAAMMFLRGDITTTDQRYAVEISPAQAIEQATHIGSWANTETAGVPERATLSAPLGLRLTDHPAAFDLTALPAMERNAPLVSRTNELVWDNPNKRVLIDAPRTKAYIGRIDDGPTKLADVTIQTKPNRQDWAAITVTAIDATDFKSPGRLLITATGYAENTDMGWKNEQKTTVGRDWGKTPSLVEGIDATITLPVGAERVTMYPLDERGNRRAPITFAQDELGITQIALSAEHKTIWYEVVIR